MTKVVLICLLAALCSSSDVKCGNYQSKAFDAKQCYEVKREDKQFQFYLGTCPENSACDFYTNFERGDCVEKVPTRLPGEYCGDTNTCRYGTCKNNICEGAKYNETCTLDEECQPGLYCNKTKICDYTIPNGQPCTNENKCGPGHVCDEKCIAMLSIETGVNSKVSAACKSFYAYNGTCVEGPKLDREDGGEGPMECTTGCSYISSAGTLTSACACGMNDGQKKYCNPGIGDVKFDDVSFH